MMLWFTNSSTKVSFCYHLKASKSLPCPYFLKTVFVFDTFPRLPSGRKNFVAPEHLDNILQIVDSTCRKIWQHGISPFSQMGNILYTVLGMCDLWSNLWFFPNGISYYIIQHTVFTISSTFHITCLLQDANISILKSIETRQGMLSGHFADDILSIEVF